ncbi:MAG: molybdopterin-guanine dinucleotide biosynthesis protein A [Natronomonas sp.]|jgi:molybdopterin-guanine dinucleotide biosynthesis protein A
MRSGVVVAGGFSTRFGEVDKPVAELAGTPLIRRVADRIEGVVDELVINCRADQRSAIAAAMTGYALDIEYALDEDPDRGPVAGVHCGLSAASGEYAVVVACDMPFVDPALVRLLFERADGTGGAIPRLDGRVQPLQAVYRREPMRRACAAALDRGERRLVAVLERLESVFVEKSEIEAVATTRTFENINTREDLRAAVDRLDIERPS